MKLVLDIETGGFKAGELAVFAVKSHTGRADVFRPLVPQQLPVPFDTEQIRRALRLPAFEAPYGGKK